MSKSLYSGLEHDTRAFLDNLRQNAGPSIYTLSPHDARAILSGLQSSIPVKKPPADIENRTIPTGIGGKDLSITIVRL
jgi:acetyl esterase